MNLKLLLIILASSLPLFFSDYCDRRVSKLIDCDGNEISISDVDLLVHKSKEQGPRGLKGEPGIKGNHGNTGLTGEKGIKGEKGSCSLEATEIISLKREIFEIKRTLNRKFIIFTTIKQISKNLRINKFNISITYQLFC